jgi:hypothetical protein
MRWRNYQGVEKPIEEIDDMHLANILKWIAECQHYPLSTYLAFQAEAKKRNLTSEFLDKAPYPHKNKDGKWIQFINGRPTVVGR